METPQIKHHVQCLWIFELCTSYSVLDIMIYRPPSTIRRSYYHYVLRTPRRTLLGPMPSKKGTPALNPAPNLAEFKQ